MRWPPTPRQLALSAGSTLLSLGLCAWIWNSREGHQTVELVNSEASVEELFRDRATHSPSLDPGLGAARLAHWPLSQSEASKMFASLGNKKNERFQLDPQTYFWARPSEARRLYFVEHPERHMNVATNALGFRKDRELMEPAPMLRVLVTGDSHTEGVASNPELFTELLEEHLRARNPARSVEVLNGAKGGFSFYNYLGVLEKFESLSPDLFVVTVYGGNDFVEAVRPRRFFEGLPRGPALPRAWQEALPIASKEFAPLVSQFLFQALNLTAIQENRTIAGDAGREVMLELARICEQRGIQLLLVYLPPAHDVQKAPIQSMLAGATELFRLSPAALDIANNLANELLADAGSHGIQLFDLRPAFQSADPFLYWQRDHHINIAGHQLVAELLTPVIEALAKP